jgi:AcrR family transcriptional regulator
MARIVKKPAERKLEIVKAARHLFQSRGYDDTSMQDVMEYLSIAKGTIYYYFKSKEELLEAVVDDIGAELLQRMEVAVDQSTGNALEKLRVLILAGNASEETGNILEELHRPGNLSLHVRLLAVALEQQAVIYARVFQLGCDEGIFQTDTPLETAEFILSAVQFMTDEGIYPWSPATLERRVAALPRLIETQLKAPAGSLQFLFTDLPHPGESS